MLVLSRKLSEQIVIGEDVIITIVQIDRGKVRLGIEAPRDRDVMRADILEKNALETIYRKAKGK